MSAIIHSTLDVENQAENLDEIWWQGRQWAVTAYGIEARDGTYHIEAAAQEFDSAMDLMGVG